MNIVKRNTAVSFSLLFLLFAAVDTAKLYGAHSKEIAVSKTYLLMPISNGAERNQTISVVVDGKEVRHVKAGLAEKKEDIDWWAFFDISAYKGKTLSVSVQPMKAGTLGLITQSDQIPGEDKWGSEPKRPQFHFSQKVGWNNDPNGMVYYKGVGKGSLCYADGMLYLLGEKKGKVGLAAATPEGFKLTGSFSIEGEGPSWAHPVVNDGRLYLRYDQNLYCFELK